MAATATSVQVHRITLRQSKLIESTVRISFLGSCVANSRALFAAPVRTGVRGGSSVSVVTHCQHNAVNREQDASQHVSGNVGQGTLG